ncbi:MAG: acetyl-CoA carboxylase biotin carboxylase subunit, partial [Planctomycetes bacterium]|nr:acetyl-CoA carboxylase biotin carboxylase subunit [Planctomycetota bacterium]
IQRRHQKLIEEAPSSVVDEAMRRELGVLAVKLVKAANYTNAGTVEFLLDSNHRFYFIEVNARIQVEHPVTEMITGLDLVREQILIAAGEPMTVRRQEDVVLRGHAIEARINAEDPDNDFKPCPGTIGHFFPPGGLGVRFDSHVHSGYRIPPHYDSMIGKIIVHRATREEAVRTMRRALSEMRVEGIKTTLPLLRRIFKKARYMSGKFDTHFVEDLLV